jgi:uncharacterized membrane-anchored protein YhcB (DUF1043 family)
MDAKWILLAGVAWLIGVLLVIILMRMASDQDRSARHTERQLDPFTDVTVTKPGQ